VIVDPEITAQKVLLAFYGLINVGASFGLATTYAEKDVGYWLAYSLPGFIYILLPIFLALVFKKTVRKPPGESDTANAFKVIGIACRKNKWRLGKGYFDAAKPSQLALKNITTHRGKPITWTDDFVEDVRRTIEACEIFLFFPFYYLNDGGIGNIETSQGSSMTTNGAPNDLLNNFNPLTIIVAIPIIGYGLYPLLRKHKIHFGPIQRITFGFLLAASSSIIGAITQWRVYKTSPCGYYATGCTIGSGVSSISI
jgi:dipeptide/tripeptide permease